MKLRGSQARPGRTLLVAVVAAAGALALGTRYRPVGDASAEAVRTPPGMVYVPGGPCLLGSNEADADDDVQPQRRVDVPAFYIDRTEVTNAEYRRFDPAFMFAPGEEERPATNVTYDQAEAYARWAGKRLPTEAEWEKAARGTDGRRYPWGSDWNPSRVASRAPKAAKAPPAPGHCGPARTRPVGSVSGGASPYGCLDMAGNAWEWVQGYYLGNPQQRILRGGAVGYGERACRTYSRAIEGAGAT
jgi:formylglycine-generating enzyme required for sulfatase activity